MSSIVPLPETTKHPPTYLIVELLHPGLKSIEAQWRSKTIKTECITVDNPQPSEDATENASLAGGQKKITDVMWDERFEFDYDEEGLEFIRCVYISFFLLYG